MKNIEITRFPGGISVQPEGAILANQPFADNLDFFTVFDDFLVVGPQWNTNADNGGDWVDGGNRYGIAQSFTAGTVLGNFATIFLPYGAFDFTEPDLKVYFQCRLASGQLGVPQLGAFGIAELFSASSGQMIAAPQDAIQFELVGQGQIDFVVYRGTVEVYRDAAVGQLLVTEAPLTVQFALEDGLIKYSVEDGRTGNTDQLPGLVNNLTVAMESQVGTGGTQATNDVDFILASQSVNRLGQQGGVS